jgi:hypothetical protein
MSVTAAGSLELAQARIGARWGQQPGLALWRRIETTRDLAAMLDSARGNVALARWLDGVAPGAGVHALERTLRGHWRMRVAELGAWMPEAWQASVLWCALLVDLPLLQHLARGHAAPPWARDDEALRACCDGHPAGDARLALLEAARADADALLADWRARWVALLPRRRGRERIERELLPLLANHAVAFAAPATAEGWAAREALRGRLALLLRRAVGEPLAAFVYLAALALELERLRAELVPRLALPAWASAR